MDELFAKQFEYFPPRESTKCKLLSAICCICSKTMQRTSMKNVPNDEETLRVWCDLLDDTFYQNWRKNSPQMVCKSHFICTHDGEVMPGALPRTEKYYHVIEAPKSTATVEQIILDSYCWDVYNLHSYSSVSSGKNFAQYMKKTRRFGNSTCCICSRSVEFGYLRCVPTDKKTLRLWIDLLGEPFIKNLENTPHPRLVCKSHLICTHDGKLMPGALPRTEKYTHLMEAPNPWPQSKPIYLDKFCLNVYGLHSYCSISKNINVGPYVDDSDFKEYGKLLKENYKRRQDCTRRNGAPEGWNSNIKTIAIYDESF